jgi:hypothetical protein
MTVGPRRAPNPFSRIENAADTALLQGDCEHARHSLIDGVRKSYVHSPEDYHHLALKTIALPFHNLMNHGSSEDRVDEALNVYGWVGVLLDTELHEAADFRDDFLAQRQRIGRITELVIFGLVARQFKDDSSLLILPSTRVDDTSPEAGVDFYLTSLNSQGKMIQLQVKTKIRSKDREQYDGTSVRLVGLSDIDSNYGQPLCADSLAQLICKDLDGTSTGYEIEILDAATEKMLLAISEQSYSTPMP